MTPLSQSQLRILLASERYKDSHEYNNILFFSFDNNLDRELFNRSFNSVLLANPVLNTVINISESGYTQKTSHYNSYTIPFYDLEKKCQYFYDPVVQALLKNYS